MLFCIDSDGCVFDNMRSKHEHAFLPAFVEVWGLKAWYPLVEKHWYAINLYSRTRGINRFAAFAHCLRQLEVEGDALLRDHLPENLGEFEQFVTDPDNRKAESLRRQLTKARDPLPFKKSLEWNQLVNSLVSGLSTPQKPFANAKTTLGHMASIGEVHVVSQAPHETLAAEWKTAGLASHVTSILGQEFGSKSEQVARACNGRQLTALLVGDAPGDEHAAAEAGALFFPIIPQQEEASWEQLALLLPAFGKDPPPRNHPDYAATLTLFHQTLR